MNLWKVVLGIVGFSVLGTWAAAQPPAPEEPPPKPPVAEAPPKDEYEVFSRHEKRWEEFVAARQKQDQVATLKAAEAVLEVERQVYVRLEMLLTKEPKALKNALDNCRDYFLVAADTVLEARAREGAFDALIALQEECLRHREELNGPDHWMTVNARLSLQGNRRVKEFTPEQNSEWTAAGKLNEEFWKLTNAGQFGDAKKVALQIEEIRTRLIGEKSPDAIFGTVWVGMSERSLKDYDAAEQTMIRAAAKGKEVWGATHPVYGWRLNELGDLYLDRNEFDKAEPFFIEASAIWKSVLGPEHVDYATGISNLAEVYRNKGEFKKAAPLYEESIRIRKAALGDRHADYALSLNNYAVMLSQIGDNEGAKRVTQEALDVRRAILGPEHPVVARSIHNLASMETHLGHDAEAVQLYLQALEIRRKTLGELHEDYAETLINLGTVYAKRRDYIRAEPACLQAVEIVRKRLGEKHPQYAYCLRRLAGVYISTDKLPQAEPLLKECVEVLKNVYGEEHFEYADGLNSLAGYYLNTGEYGKAEELTLKADALLRRRFGERHPALLIGVHTLASIFGRTGRSELARESYLQALELRRISRGEDDANSANVLIDFANFCEKQGDFPQAMALGSQATEVFRKAYGEGHPSYAKGLMLLGKLRQSTGESAAAEQLYARAAEIYKATLGESHADYGSSITALGGLYFARGEIDRAEAFSRKADDICRATLGESHPEYATSQANMGEIYRSKGDLLQAEALHKKAIEINKSVFGVEHRTYAWGLYHLAQLHQAKREIPQAETLYREALETLTKVQGEDHSDVAHMATFFASLYAGTDDPAPAAPLCERALRIQRQSLNSTASVLSERQQLAMSESLRSYLDTYLTVLLRLKGHEQEAAEAVFAWKGSTMMRQRAARLVSSEPELKPLFNQLQSVTRRWSAQVYATVEPAKAESHRKELEALSQEKERLEAELSQKSEVFRAATRPLSLAEAQALLPGDAAVVDYLEFWKFVPSESQPGNFEFVRSLVAFVIRPGKPVRMFDLGPVAPIDAAVEQWRKSYGLSAESAAAGRTLRTLLWEPVAEAIEGARTVIVSPDGAVGRIPFAALPGKAEKTFLIEDHRLAIVPVPQLIPALLQSSPVKLNKDLLLMGDVDYDHRPADVETPEAGPKKRKGRFDVGGDTRAVTAGATWSRLSGAAAEVAFIKDLYKRVFEASDESIIDRREAMATEEQFRESAPQCHILHLATHGFFAPPDKKSAETADADRGLRGSPFGVGRDFVRGYSPGLLSGLVFAGANHPPEIPSDPLKFAELPDDGILTADEIASLPLNGVRLVVLSACETGLGEVAGGEALLGIQRAFQVSGARTTVASLWQVDDLVTRRLMEEFYRNYLEKEMSALDSLREAQLWLLRNPDQLRGLTRTKTETEDARMSPPFYWAAFTLSGDWR
jgi:CHAT domain-containing protein/Tfp pilus assembly protein PilF